MSSIISPAEFTFLGIPMVVVSILIPLVGIGVFAYIVRQRLVPMRAAAGDERTDEPAQRWKNFFSLWLAQSRQLRYKSAGIIHLVIFFGFLVLSIRATSLVFIGMNENFVLPQYTLPAGTVRER